jgi:holo-[acyl-carrier protein] synthase
MNSSDSGTAGEEEGKKGARRAGEPSLPLGLTADTAASLQAPTRVLGIGVDIVETARIESSIERFGDRFLRRIFTQGERDYCSAMPFPARHYAARFAAKEAVSKAFGTGIGRQIGWCDVEVKRKESGEPHILLHGSAADLAARLGVLHALVSLSHSDHYAVANAILVARP